MSQLEGIARQGAYAEAYVSAIAAASGYVYANYNLDSGHKIDRNISGAGEDSTTRSPRLDIQVKSTGRNQPQQTSISYRIDRDLYGWITKPRHLLHIPRVIVLVQVPAEPEAWMIQESDDYLKAQHCAYWLTLEGGAEIEEAANSTTINFPLDQKFDVPGLSRLMTKIKESGWL